MKAIKIKYKLLTIVLIVALSLLISGAPLAVLALEVNDGESEYVYQWSGNGKNSLDCSKAGEGDRPDDGTGWIHWVFTGKGNSTDAILTLGGSGNGSYSPGEPLEANVWHFYTPYYDVYELTASITLIGGDKGPGVGLVISDYCPGEEEEETGSIIIEKLIKAELDAEVVIPSNKVFFFNIYNNETDELVLGDVELEVIDGVGTVTIDNLPLGIYRVEEVENGGYQVILDPEDGIVDLTAAEENTVTVVVVNTPRPKLIVEKVLLDPEGVEIENSDVEFTVILDGGLFEEEEIAFSVNEPAVLDFIDGLEFDVPYTVTEVPKEGYLFISIDPDEAFTLTDEENEVIVTVVNQEEEEEEEEEETGSIIIEKLIKAEVDAEVVIPSNKVFFFNIYNNETDELVLGDVELEVIDGVGTVTIDNLPLGIYRVEEVANGGYQVILDPEDGIVDLTTAEENEVTVVVVNTPKPKLVIEKVLLDAVGVEVENSDIEFTVILDGGLFDEQEIAFSVNKPAVLDISDGLEFEVPYTVTEVPKEGYLFISIDPDEAFTLTDEENEVSVTVVNQMISPPPPPPLPPVIIFAPPVPPQVIVVPPAEPQVSPPPQVIVIPPAAPQVVVQLPPQGGVEEEDAIAFFVSPEDPLAEPEEVLVVQPAIPLSTPRTGGFYLNMILASLAFIGSGIIIRKQLI